MTDPESIVNKFAAKPKDSSAEDEEEEKKEEVSFYKKMLNIINSKVFDFSIFNSNKDEFALLENLMNVKSGKENLPHWYRSNLFYPLIIIGVSVIVTFFANYHSTYSIGVSYDCLLQFWEILKSDKFIKCLNSSIFNGSISLVAINALLGASNHTLSSETLGGQDSSQGINQLYNLRKKYNFKLFSTFFYVSVLYIVQIAFPPDTILGLFLYLVVIIATLRKSLKVSKTLYYLRDEIYTEYSENNN